MPRLDKGTHCKWVTTVEFESNIWRLIDEARKNSFFWHLRDLHNFVRSLKQLMYKWTIDTANGYLKRPLPEVEVVNNNQIIQFWKLPLKKRICMSYPIEWISIQKQKEAIDLKRNVTHIDDLKKVGDYGWIDGKNQWLMADIYGWIWEKYEREPNQRKRKK